MSKELWKMSKSKINVCLNGIDCKVCVQVDENDVILSWKDNVMVITREDLWELKDGIGS